MARNKHDIQEDVIVHTVLTERDFTSETGCLTRQGLLKLERLLRGDHAHDKEEKKEVTEHMNNKRDLENHIQNTYHKG